MLHSIRDLLRLTNEAKSKGRARDQLDDARTKITLSRFHFMSRVFDLATIEIALHRQRRSRRRTYGRPRKEFRTTEAIAEGFAHKALETLIRISNCCKKTLGSIQSHFLAIEVNLGI